MSYSIKTRDGIQIHNIPDGMPEDSPQLKALVNRERTARAQERADAPETKAEAARMTYRDMSRTDKVLSNLGAGFDTFKQGVGQLIGKGPTDDELRESRQMKGNLAKQSDMGIGPDWAPTLGGTTQFIGEAAPTLAIPAGAVTRGATALPRAINAGRGWWGPARGAAAAGAAGGLAQPVLEGESRALNTGAGAVLGGALPLAGRAWRGARSRYTEAGGRDRAPDVLRQALGDEAEAIAAGADARTAARAGQTPEVRAIDETLAESTGSIRAANLESKLGRDDELIPEWSNFRRGQNEARYGAVEEATRSAPHVEGRIAERRLHSNPVREAALDAARGDPTIVGPVQNAMQDIMRSPNASNASVRAMIEQVRRSMDPNVVGPLTPGHLHEIRKVLDKALHGPVSLTDPMDAVIKGADVQARRLIAAIDEGLNTASGGQWNPWLRHHGLWAGRVSEARGARGAREVINAAPLLGNRPHVTPTTMAGANRALASRYEPTQSVLDPHSQRIMQETTEQLRHATEPQRTRKYTGTAGGGSQTSTDLNAALSRFIQTQGGGLTMYALNALSRGADNATRAELTRLLQNPPAAAAAIRQAIAARQPLTQAQELLLSGFSGGAGTAAAQPRGSE